MKQYIIVVCICALALSILSCTRQNSSIMKVKRYSMESSLQSLSANNNPFKGMNETVENIQLISSIGMSQLTSSKDHTKILTKEDGTPMMFEMYKDAPKDSWKAQIQEAMKRELNQVIRWEDDGFVKIVYPIPFKDLDDEFLNVNGNNPNEEQCSSMHTLGDLSSNCCTLLATDQEVWALQILGGVCRPKECADKIMTILPDLSKLEPENIAEELANQGQELSGPFHYSFTLDKISLEILNIFGVGFIERDESGEVSDIIKILFVTGVEPADGYNPGNLDSFLEKIVGFIMQLIKGKQLFQTKIGYNTHEIAKVYILRSKISDDNSYLDSNNTVRYFSQGGFLQLNNTTKEFEILPLDNPQNSIYSFQVPFTVDFKRDPTIDNGRLQIVLKDNNGTEANIHSYPLYFHKSAPYRIVHNKIVRLDRAPERLSEDSFQGNLVPIFGQMIFQKYHEGWVKLKEELVSGTKIFKFHSDPDTSKSFTYDLEDEVQFDMATFDIEIDGCNSLLDRTSFNINVGNLPEIDSYKYKNISLEKMKTLGMLSGRYVHIQAIVTKTEADSTPTALECLFPTLNINAEYIIP